MTSPQVERWKTQRLELPEAVLSVSWEPAGHRLAALTTSGDLEFLSMETAVGKTIHAHSDGGLAMSWSAAGVATSGTDGMLRFWSPDVSDKPLAELDCSGKWVEQMVWSPDGSQLLFAAGKEVRVVNAEGKTVYSWDGHPATVTAVAWRPDGKGFATSTFGGARLFRLSEPEPHQVLEWSGPLLSIAWSPNARFLASGSQEGTIRFWRLPYRPGEELQMTGYPSKVKELAWNREGRFLASGGGENITIWDVAGKGPANTTPLVFEEHPGRISVLAFQPDGDLLFSGDRAGELAIWRLPSTDSLLHEELEGSVISAAWKPGALPCVAVGTDEGELAIFTASS